MHYFLVLFIGLLSFSGTAQAACTAPAGITGDQIFNSTYKTMQFCDGNKLVLHERQRKAHAGYFVLQ